jgi:quercetin dioxygenase-like cupin family protein
MTNREDSGVYAQYAKLGEHIRRGLAVWTGAVATCRGIRVAGLAMAASGLAVGIALAASMVIIDTTDVRLRVVQSEFENGFDSGWHIHPGPVIVQVQEGNFKIYQGGCEPNVVHAGDSYIEVPFVPVRAIAKGRIRWTTSQILPVGFAAQDPAGPPCQ